MTMKGPGSSTENVIQNDEIVIYHGKKDKLLHIYRQSLIFLRITKNIF